MKISEIKEKTKDELIAELAKTQKERFVLNFQKKTGGVEGSEPKLHSIKQLRRKVARIKTILNEKMREVHE